MVKLKEKEGTNNKPIMSQNKKKRGETEIEIIMRQTGGSYTKCAGVLALWRLWQRMDVASLLAEADISYGKEENKAPSLSFAKTVGPLVGAASDRRIAQRFGGEASARWSKIISTNGRSTALWLKSATHGDAFTRRGYGGCSGSRS